MKRCKRLIGIVLGMILLVSTAAWAKPDEVVFGDQSWDSIQFHHRVLAFILEQGYDLKPSFNFSETMPGLLGLQRGNNHIVMEIWVDARLEWWEMVHEKDLVRDMGAVFPNAPSGWYVPRYMIEGDPARGIEPVAPDLKTAFDLEKYWKFFKNPENPKKGRFYTAPPGWAAHERNKTKMKGYGLDKYFDLFDPGSQTALATAIRGAYTKGQPVVAYYWEPTPLLGELDMVLLKEPDYDPEIWTTTQLCQNPAFRVNKAVNTKWLQKHPQVEPLLRNYHMSLEQTNRALAWLKAHGSDPDKTAIWFLKEYPDLWKSWIEDTEVVGKVEVALEKK